jgi:hypothetical protein
MLSQGVSNNLGRIGEIRPSTEPGIWTMRLPIQNNGKRW